MAYTDTTGIILHLPTPGTREPAAIALLNENFVALAAHNHVTSGTPVGRLRSGLLADRPAFGTVGAVYVGTDTAALYVDTGAAWSTLLNTSSVAAVNGWTLTGVDHLTLGGTPAAAGRIRLTNNDIIGWRNAGGTADYQFYLSAVNDWTWNNGVANRMQLLSNGNLQINEGEIGVGMTPSAWHPDWRAVQLASNGAVAGNTANGGVYLRDNSYVDAASASRAIVAAAGGAFNMQGGAITYYTAPSVAAGATQTFTARLSITTEGVLSIMSAAGSNYLNCDTSVLFLQRGAGSAGRVGAVGDLELYAGSQAVVPQADSYFSLGKSGLRWASVWSSNGTIQTSTVAEKEHFTRLDPADALDAVLATDLYTFQYQGHDRWHAGFLAEEAHPLLCPDGATVSPQTTASLALAAIRALAAKIEALEGKN